MGYASFSHVFLGGGGGATCHELSGPPIHRCFLGPGLFVICDSLPPLI